VQAHTIHGGIRFGPEVGLGSASSVVPARPAGGPGKITIAARWAYALVSSVADLAARVAAALTAIRGLT
jgi:hypothetical protein